MLGPVSMGSQTSAAIEGGAYVREPVVMGAAGPLMLKRC